MIGRFETRGIVAALVAGLCLAALPARAQDPTKDEFNCEVGFGKAVTKLLGAASKCGATCLATQRKAAVPDFTPCFTVGGDLLTCVLAGATKAGASITKACVKDCPECYTAQGATMCTDGNPFITNLLLPLGTINQGIHCNEFGGSAGTKLEQKCEDTVGKALLKLSGSLSKCYTVCNTGVFKGKITPATACNPPGNGEPKLQSCVSTANTKAAAAIDKACVDAVSKPACYMGKTGAGFVADTNTTFNAQEPLVGCGA